MVKTRGDRAIRVWPPPFADSAPPKTEVSWAAGLFDGDGCTTVSPAAPKLRRRTKRQKLGLQYPQLRVSVTQHHDPEVLHRFHKAMGGLGYVEGPHKVPPGDSERWRYRANGETAVRVLGVLWPYLSGPKKAQARRKVRIWKNGGE